MATNAVNDKQKIEPGMRRMIFGFKLREYLQHDAHILHSILGLTGTFAAFALLAIHKTKPAFKILSKLHRANYGRIAKSSAEWLVRRATNSLSNGRQTHPLVQVLREHVTAGLTDSPMTRRILQHPEHLLGSLAIVLKSPGPNEKGVLLLTYSQGYLLFHHLYDIRKVASKYHLVLEPDWSGYCNHDLLTYAGLSFPIFVEAYEPRDADFISSLKSNLVVVPTSTNWWVDHRMFRPLPHVSKDVDIVMVAAWGIYKRHFRFFEALRRLRQTQVVPKVLLLGYTNGFSKEDIVSQARHFGVADQLEICDSVAYGDVNAHFARAKVNILWSRKEGVNRAIVEGMFANVPVLMRRGFNYGYHYPYINEQTGCFASESELPEKLSWMIENYQSFSPRQWVMQHMTCQIATQRMENVIREISTRNGECWTEGLAVKTNHLTSMPYWGPSDQEHFRGDYEFLRTAIRTATSEPQLTMASR
jgi:glycosyltransferase involved in cell wall biosynthesis